MKSVTCILALLLACTFSTTALARDRIFGLAWQSTPAQLRAEGIALTQQRAQGRLTMYLTSSLPKNLSDAESYLLIFDKDMGLVKIMMVGKNISNDPQGAHGKKRFAELGRILVGRGYRLHRHQTVMHVDPQANGFYACLFQASCGVWQQVYSKDKVTVLLRLRGAEDGTGYIMMSFQEEPQFSQALKKNRQKTMSKDAQAF